MWAEQIYFRISVQGRLDNLLEQLGADVDPRIFLVGFAPDVSPPRYPICIEPESGPLSPADLDNVVDRASQFYGEHPRSQGLYGDAAAGERAQDRLRWEMRAVALSEAIEATEFGSGRRAYVSPGAAVAGYEVHTCLVLNEDFGGATHRLVGSDIRGFPTPSSFPEGAIYSLLREVDAAAHGREPGIGALTRSAQDLAVEAAQSFCAGCSFRADSYLQPYFFDDISSMVEQSYESSAAGGRMIFVHPDHPALEARALLSDPVTLDRTRRVRKLLEVGRHDLGLLVHDGAVYGFGVVGASEAAGPEVFEVVVLGRASWELRTQEHVLLRCDYGRPTLPHPVVSGDELLDTLDRFFPDSANPELLTELIAAVAMSGHGATLVVSDRAGEEAQRLAGQSTLIDPAVLTPATLTEFCAIDGATLIDPSGTCHAIGVILDGQAEGEGDPSRGSRYNSALKYQRGAAGTTLVVVVSEDGDVTQVPKYVKRIHRQEVEDVVTAFSAAVDSGRLDVIARARSAVQRFGEYLSPAQVEIVNDLTRQLEDEQRTRREIVLLERDLEANLDLDDTYFRTD